MWSIYIEVYRNTILFSKKVVHTTKFHDGDSICVLNRPKYEIAARLKIVFFPPYFNKLLLMQSINSSFKWKSTTNASINISFIFIERDEI